MDGLSLHLILNHVPAVGATGALLLLAWGVVRRSADVTAAALATFVIVAVVAVPVFLSGNEAVGRLNGSSDIDTALVERHRGCAVASMVGLEAAAATAIAALWAGRSRRRFPLFPALATLLIGLTACVLLIRTVSLGGEIRHRELRASVVGRQ